VFGNIGWQEVIFIVVIFLLLFGARRLPEMMKSMGQGVREFKKAMSGITEPDEDEDKSKSESTQQS
jgi:sec-independent protein translocase protein TatA